MNILYDGFHKIESFVTLIKGKEKLIERVKIKDGVAALVIDADNKIALVGQYRPCIEKYTLEIPAGLLDKEGKTPKEVLIEELQEECGISPEEIAIFNPNPIIEYYPVCGSSDLKMQIFYVELNTVKESMNVDDADVDSVMWLTYEQLDNVYQNNKIIDGKTLMTYLFYSSAIEG